MAIGPIRERVKVYWQSEDPGLPEEAAVAFDPARFEWVERASEARFVVTGPPRSNSKPQEGASLTSREQEILEYLADGWSNEEIADRLGITPHTVKFHLGGLYQKLGVGRRTEAVREALRQGYLRM